MKRDEVYIIPDLFQLCGELNLKRQGLKLSFEVEYPKVMPKSIMPRLIVGMHPYIQGDKRWRTAIVLEENREFNVGAIILAQRQEVGGKIYIEILGEKPREFLSFIRGTLNEIHKDFKDLKIKELVPYKDKIRIDYKTHTQYSLLDGAASIPGLFKKAAADGMKALAITDHGNMFGVFQFVAEAAKHEG